MLVALDGVDAESAAVSWTADDLLAFIVSRPGLALTFGIGLTIGGSCLMSLGNVLMKNAIHQESKRFQRNVLMPVSSHLWWMGLLAYCTGAALHIFGLAFAPASVLAPLNSFGLVANAAAAIVFLGEKLSHLQFLYTVGTIVGVSLCAASSFIPHENAATVDGLASWSDPLYLGYVSVCAASLIVLLVLINNAEARMVEEQWEKYFDRHLEAGHIELAELSRIQHPEILSTLPGVPTALSNPRHSAPSRSHGGVLKREAATRVQRTHAASGDDNEENQQLLLPPEQGVIPGRSCSSRLATYPTHIGLFYGVVAGIVGAQCVLQLKELSAFFKVGFESPRLIWHSIQPYLSSAFGIASIILQMHFLNLSLARGEATLVIPTYYVSWTVAGTIGGFLKFHEIYGFTIFMGCTFLVGFILTLVSVSLMASLEMVQVKTEVDRTVPPALGAEVRERYYEAPLNMGVPLAVGIGIIPIGRLAGRLRAVNVSSQYDYRPIRRTQSFIDFAEAHTESVPGGETTVTSQELAANESEYTARGCNRYHGGDDNKIDSGYPSMMGSPPIATSSHINNYESEHNAQTVHLGDRFSSLAHLPPEKRSKHHQPRYGQRSGGFAQPWSGPNRVAPSDHHLVKLPAASYKASMYNWTVSGVNPLETLVSPLGHLPSSRSPETPLIAMGNGPQLIPDRTTGSDSTVQAPLLVNSRKQPRDQDERAGGKPLSSPAISTPGLAPQVPSTSAVPRIRSRYRSVQEVLFDDPTPTDPEALRLRSY